MLVFMISTDYLPNIGGIAAHIYNLSYAMVKLGHTVAVINPVASDKADINMHQHEGIWVVRVGVNQNTPAFRNKIYRKRLFSKAAKLGILKAKEKLGTPDIIHQHDYQDTTKACCEFSKQTPWIWTNHSSRFLRDYQRKMKMKWIRHSYSKTSGIITVSEELRDKTRHLWGNISDIGYITNGVNTERFHHNVEADRSAYQLGDDEFVVLCPRRMARKNGVLFLARAVDLCLEQAPEIPWKFVFLGSDAAINTHADYIEEIKSTLVQANEKGAIKYMGNIPLDEMPELNALPDIVMMPSLMEAVSLSALEGMASRKAMVTTNVGGLPEIIHHEQTGLLVPPENPEAIAEALIRLARDPQLRESVALKGQQLAQEKYSWDAVAKQTIDYYQKIVKA